MNLPSIVKENSLIHKHSPFTFTDKDLKAVIRPSSSLEVRVWKTFLILIFLSENCFNSLYICNISRIKLRDTSSKI